MDVVEENGLHNCRESTGLLHLDDKFYYADIQLESNLCPGLYTSSEQCKLRDVISLLWRQ